MADRIDLNCDLGEGAGTDQEILPFITSANIACGYHAGDAATMRATVRGAIAHRVAIGAHPGLKDRKGFGRTAMKLDGAQARSLILEQLAALGSIVSAEGARLRHVKPHGALYHMATDDRVVAEAIVSAVRDFDPDLVLVGFPGSELLRAGREAGLRVAAEAFADRTYQADGSLTPRSQAGALIDDVDQAAAQAIRIVRGESGIHAETICIHGDGPHAATFAREIRRRLESAGISVAPLT